MSYADVSPRVDLSRRLSKCVPIVCLTIAALSAHAPTASASPIITAVPTSSNVLVNGLFTVNFELDDFTDLFAFQMGVVYDPSLLSVVSVTEGNHLASGGGTSFFSGDPSTPGLISFIANSLSGLSGVNGPGTLFSVQFQAIGLGMANVAAFFDPDPLVGDGLYNSAFELTTPSVQGAQVSISASQPPTSVPEPATILSLGFGVAVVAAARRRERRRLMPRR